MEVDKTGEILWKVGHANLAAEMRPLLRPNASLTLFYWLANLALLALIAAAILSARGDRFVAFSTACLGMFAAWLLLVPVHEVIHALAYRLTGARNVKIRYEWRRMTALCVADGEVVGATAFISVCLAPFVVLNATLAALAAFSSGTPRLMLLGALLLHTGACSGDFALARFTLAHRDRGVVTWDDAAAGVTWFVARR